MIGPPTPRPSGPSVGQPYPRDAALSRALLANALFSSLSGIGLLLFPGTVAALLGGLPVMVVRIVGTGLIAFGLTVALLSSRRPVHPHGALVVTLADVWWVGGSLIAVFLWSDIITGPGLALVMGVAAAVACFGLLQFRGLVVFARNVGGSTAARSRFVLARPVPEQPDIVWGRLRSLDLIGEHFDALSRVDVQEINGVTRRTCSTVDGGRWTEEVVKLNDASRDLVLRFDMAKAPFPLPVTEMWGGWRVRPHGDGSFLVLWYELTLRGGLAGQVLAALADPVFRRQLGPVLESLGARATETDPVVATEPPV